MKQDKKTIKTYFEKGDVPTEEQFVHLIDSYIDSKQETGKPNRRFVIDENGEVTVTEEQRLPEYSLTKISNTKIGLVKNNNIIQEIDLSNYIDDTNLARLVSGTLDTNGIATFKRDDNSTFTVDFGTLFNNTGQSTGLEKINQGWRLIGKDATKYGKLGVEAVDISSAVYKTDTGAKGDYSFSSGLDVTASGTAAHAEGYITEASGAYSHAECFATNASGHYSHAEGGGTESSGGSSHAEGNNTLASGFASHAGGTDNTAPSFTERVIGSFATNYTPKEAEKFNEEDRVFNIGNGISTTQRSDALTVFKNGKILAPSLDVTQIDKPKSIVTKEYVDQIQILEYQAGTNISIDNTNPLKPIISSITNNNVTSIINTTHSNILNLISSNNLTPEQEYSFEFKNIYKQIDSDIIKLDAPTETLVVKAETNNKLYSTVRSLNYIDDEIKYDVNITTFEGFDESNKPVTNISNQGTILNRIDKNLEIETPYDFRTEKFIRYKGIVPLHDENASYSRFSVVKAPNDLSYVRVAIDNNNPTRGNNIDDLLKWQKMPFASSLTLLEDYKFTKNNSYLNITIDTNDSQEFLTFSNTHQPTKEQAYKIKLYNKNIIFSIKAIESEVKYFESNTIDGLTLRECVDVKLHVGRNENNNTAYTFGVPLIDSIIGMDKKLLVINGNTRIERIANINISNIQSKVHKTIDSNPDLFISTGFMASLSNCNFIKGDGLIETNRVVGNFFRRDLSGTFRNDIRSNVFVNYMRNVYCEGYLSSCKIFADVQNVIFRGNVSGLDFVFDPENNIIAPNESYTNLIQLRDCVFDCDIIRFNIYYPKAPLGRQTRIRLYNARFSMRELSGTWSIPTAATNTKDQYNYKFYFSNYFKDENGIVTLFYEKIDKDGNITNIAFTSELL